MKPGTVYGQPRGSLKQDSSPSPAAGPAAHSLMAPTVARAHEKHNKSAPKTCEKMCRAYASRSSLTRSATGTAIPRALALVTFRTPAR